MHIAVTEADGELLVRDALVAAFFCQQSYPKLAKPFGQVFEEWLARIPDEVKRWAIVGPDAEAYKALTPKLLARARAEFDPARAKTRDLCSNELGGPQEINPDHQFTFVGTRDIDDETNVLEIRSPSAEAEPDNVERYVQAIHGIAECLPYDSGYASLALTWGADSQQMAFAKAARKWAFRHPGFDVPDNSASRFTVGTRLRGAYWLTFIGPKALDELGGQAALRKALPKKIDMHPAGVGVMLRASQFPELGDVNRQQVLPELRAMAKVLKKVTLFGDTMLDNNFTSEAQRERWELRHLA